MTHSFRVRGILALLLVTLVWGTTFPAMQELTAYFSPVWIVFVRFTLAGLLLAPFLWRAGRDDLVSGSLLGALLIAGMIVSQWKAAPPRPSTALAAE